MFEILDSDWLCDEVATITTHMFSFTSCSFQDRFFVEFDTFAHAPQTYEGRRCLQYGIMSKVQSARKLQAHFKLKFISKKYFERVINILGMKIRLLYLIHSVLDCE